MLDLPAPSATLTPHRRPADAGGPVRRPAGQGLHELGIALAAPGGRHAAAAPGPLAPDATAAAAHDGFGRRLGQMLDLLDYGLLLLDAGGRVQHLNRAARRELDAGHPLQLVGGRLHARTGADAAALRDALHLAALRGLRRLMSLGHGEQRASLAVVPLPRLDDEPQHGVALLLARRQVCEQLTVEWFARGHGLTMAETMVVRGLAADLTPQQIAERQGVGLATIRTQIGSIRTKTGANSIRALMRQVSLLPPLVSVLGAVAGAAATDAGGRSLNA